MHFAILGPLAVTTDDGDPVVVPGAKVRMLLADLLAHRNRVVSADRLIEDLWGDDPPANAAGALQVRVSQQRDVPERQRTLAAVIAWSWDLLPEPDRRVLARLAVFRDGCTPDA
ncbi:MAG: winged helix-turn-helix domain-containing protein, partial [Actinoplanes sp.]